MRRGQMGIAWSEMGTVGAWSGQSEAPVLLARGSLTPHESDLANLALFQMLHA
jgi:hypothetical protein